MTTSTSPISRRDALKTTLAAAGAVALASPTGAAEPAARRDPRRASPKRYAMKKSINLWAFPYPDRMSLEQCLRLAKEAGFDGIELNYDLDNDLSPKASPKHYHNLRKLAEKIGIAISGLCSFLFWPYPFTSHDAARRNRALELAGLMTE